MAVNKRLNEELSMFKNAEGPLTGEFLAKHFDVSRQVIVADIGRLRDKGIIIHSTPKGYEMDASSEITKIFKTYHTEAQTGDEMNLIVDLGAEVKDVFVFHRVYGEIHAKLNVRSRKDVKQFCDNIRDGRSSLLSNITRGYHYHTVTAPDMETMDQAEKALRDNGYLARLTDYEPEGVTGLNL